MGSLEKVIGVTRININILFSLLKNVNILCDCVKYASLVHNAHKENDQSCNVPMHMQLGNKNEKHNEEVVKVNEHFI